MQEINTRDMPRQQIKQLRLKMGISQAKMAGLLGICERALRKRENGEIPVKAEMLFAMQFVYNRHMQKRVDRAARSAVSVIREHGLHLN